MAPAKTSKAPKSATKAKNPTVKATPTPKRPSKPNASILNFFQKTAGPNDSLFVGGSASILDTKSDEPALDVEDDIYGDGDHSREDRFNELEGSSKKRKLSSDHDQATIDTPSRTKVQRDRSVAQAETRSLVPSMKKVHKRGPFLDDSDSDDDEPERDADSNTPLTSHSPMSRTDPEPQPSLPKPSKTNSHHGAEQVPQIESDSIPLIRQETSMGEYTGFEELNDPDDEAFEGEELREMRFFKQQAQLEAATDDGAGIADDGFETLMKDDGATATCPICDTSLVGMAAQEVSVHVNSCLDGSAPTALVATENGPAPSSTGRIAVVKKEEFVENITMDLVPGPELGKRFARAAIARPGQVNPIELSTGGGATDSSNPKSGTAFSKLMSGHAEDIAWSTAAAAENAARGKPAYQRTCPFYKIMPGLALCVDAFRYGAVEGCRGYFLSHFHSDHYIGLTSSWTHGPIYCSKVTGSLCKTQLRVAEKWVVPLEFEEKVLVPGTDNVYVTMIPANHCPGSSLFLFEKEVSNPNQHAKSMEKRTQRILHCGDFRACPAHIEHPQLKPETTDALGKIKQQKIDICYLDTTYLNPRYSFPPQTDVSSACADLCRELDDSLKADDDSRWNAILKRREGKGGSAGNDDVSRFFVTTEKLTNEEKAALKDGDEAGKLPLPEPNAFSALDQHRATMYANRNRLLVVCGTYSIGKERICKAIALALKTKIFASPHKIKIVQQLNDPVLSSLMTNDPCEAQVHMQMLMEIRAETLTEYVDGYKPYFGRAIAFRPSGWSYRPTMANNNGTAAASSSSHTTNATLKDGGKLGAGVGGGGVAAAAVTANLPPSSVPTTQILHGPAWRTRFGPRDLIPQQGSSKDAMCFGVPYSEHSSFRELALFVMSLRIEKVVPTVNVGSEPSRRRMKGWTDRWLSERRRGGVTRLLKLEEKNEDGLDIVKKEESGDDDHIVVVDESGGMGGKARRCDDALWDGKDGRGGTVQW